MAEPKSAGLWANSVSGGAGRYRYTDIPSVTSDTSGMFVVRKALDHANHPQGAVISLNKIIFHCPLHPSIIGDPRPQLTKENISSFTAESLKAEMHIQQVPYIYVTAC